MDTVTWHIEGVWDRPDESIGSDGKVPFCYAYPTQWDAVRAALRWIAEQDPAVMMCSGAGLCSVTSSALRDARVDDTIAAVRDGRLQLRRTGPLRVRMSKSAVHVSAPVEMQVVRFVEERTEHDENGVRVTRITRRPVVALPWSGVVDTGFGQLAVTVDRYIRIERRVTYGPPEHGRRAFLVRWNQLTAPKLPAHCVAHALARPAEGRWPARWFCQAWVEAPDRETAMAVAAVRVRREDVPEDVFRSIGWFDCDEIAWGRYEAAVAETAGAEE